MDSPTDTIEPSRTTVEAAAMWHAQLGDEGCSEADRAAFDIWMDIDPSHRIAFDRMATIAHRAAEQPLAERTALKAMLSRRPGSRGAVTAILLAGFAGWAAWWASDNADIRSRFAAERTRIGEQRVIPLASGDQVTMDSDTALDIDDEGRTIRLWRGRIMADVKHDRPRAFVVRTPQGTARALGTLYDVRIAGSATEVVVVASRVEACTRSAEEPCITLAPGEAARLDRTGATRLPNVDPLAAQSWSRGLLSADDRPLSAVVEELNRYRTDPIGYDAREIEGLRVSGTFPLRDSDRALASIVAALPVRIERRPDGIALKRR